MSPCRMRPARLWETLGLAQKGFFQGRGNRMDRFDLWLAVIVSMAGWVALTMPARG
jgi:hypothetical protein